MITNVIAILKDRNIACTFPKMQLNATNSKAAFGDMISTISRPSSLIMDHAGLVPRGVLKIFQYLLLRPILMVPSSAITLS